jgi:hypothetical protein
MEKEKQRLHHHAMMSLAVTMISRGYTTTIVNIETGVSLNTIRELHREIHNNRPSSGQLPQSSHLMHSTKMQKQASLYLTFYEKFGGPEVYKKINIRALFLAHDQYEAARADIKEFRDLKEAEIIKPSEGWVLARDLRSSEFELFDCSCGCRAVKYDYPMIRQCCPFCEMKLDTWHLGRKIAINREEARLSKRGQADFGFQSSAFENEGFLSGQILAVSPEPKRQHRLPAAASRGRGRGCRRHLK